MRAQRTLRSLRDTLIFCSCPPPSLDSLSSAKQIASSWHNVWSCMGVNKGDHLCLFSFWRSRRLLTGTGLWSVVSARCIEIRGCNTAKMGTRRGKSVCVYARVHVHTCTCMLTLHWFDGIAM